MLDFKQNSFGKMLLQVDEIFIDEKIKDALKDLTTNHKKAMTVT